MRTFQNAALAIVAVASLASCATVPDESAIEGLSRRIVAESFRARGQATLDRLTQDEVQQVCTRHPGEVPRAIAEKLESGQAALVRYPADSRFLGDWREGERIAQTGVGKQWSDNPAQASGGNCYACHQLSPKELSFGTIGPSLYRYGRLRGTGEAMLRYTWGRLWNPQAFTACSLMPRFGHNGILTEEQIRNVMALLFDPQSPVND